MEFTIEKCKKKAAYKAKPIKRCKLNITGIKKKFKVISDARIAIVVDVDGHEVIVQEYGELTFKEGKEEDKKKFKTIAEKIYKAGML